MNILNMLYTLRFFFLFKMQFFFHNANLFGSCIIHILYTGCAKIKKKIRRQRVKERNNLNSYFIIYKLCTKPCPFLLYVYSLTSHTYKTIVTGTVSNLTLAL